MTVAKIEQVPLLADTAVTWTLREGPFPVVETFHIRPQDVALLAAVAGRRPVTLTVDDGNGRPVVARNLWVIEFPRTENPNIAAVRLADRRWFWPYKFVPRRYNIRRNVGVRREARPDGVLELERVFPDVWYHRWSLRDERGMPPAAKWTALEVLRDVLEEVSLVEEELRGSKPAIRFDANVGRNVPVEDLVLFDSGENAVKTAFDYLPEASVYVDLDGDLRVYSKVSGAEEGALVQAGPEVVGEGHVARVQNVFVRPREIHVLFQREVEVRFDYLEEAKAVTTTIAARANDDKRLVDNVLQVPDFILRRVTDNFFGVVQAFDATQGTWISFDAALRAWADAVNGAFPVGAGFRNAGPVIDHEFIQIAVVPFMDLWTGMALLGQAVPDADWLARISAVKQHYRRSYRINSRWLDRFLSIRAYRVAAADPVHGTRASAVVYSDYAVVGTQRAWFQNRDQAFYVKNQERGIGPGEAITDRSKPAPAEVTVVDSDQGIFRLEYKVDPYKVHDAVLPGKVDRGSLPEGNLHKTGRRGRTLLWNGRSDNQSRSKVPKLSASHKLATILTAVPAAPTGKDTVRQLHRVVVRPDEVKEALPPRARENVGEALGPPMEILVPAGVEVARVRWSDARATDIEKIFGLGEGEPNLGGLVVNELPGDPRVTGASLNTVALAVAARMYASLADRSEGTMAGRINPRVVPAGWLGEVSFNLETDGEATVGLTLPEKLPKMNFFAFLDDATRQVLMRMPQPPAGQ